MDAVSRILSGRLMEGDCIDLLKTLPDNSIDSCVTDPPYHLTSIVKRFGSANAAPVKDYTPSKENATGAYARASRGFMGQVWDGGDISFRAELWAEVLRVLKPGAHLLAFSGTRTYHRMACAIEDAGFEIRDQIGWTYGTGFPKSHNLDGEYEGWGSALKPAWEPICVARKPLIGTIAESMQTYGVGAFNIDGCRIETCDDLNGGRYSDSKIGNAGNTYGPGINLRSKNDFTQPIGRWPANIIHDGSDEVLALFPISANSPTGKPCRDREASADNRYPEKGSTNFAALPGMRRTDAGSAARFFYQAKASKKDRRGSSHPTVKPISLIRYLARLVTPLGGIVLDPFAGSGTLAEAAALEGFDFMLMEREEKYCADIRKRIAEFVAERAPEIQFVAEREGVFG